MKKINLSAKAYLIIMISLISLALVLGTVALVINMKDNKSQKEDTDNNSNISSEAGLGEDSGTGSGSGASSAPTKSPSPTSAPSPAPGDFSYKDDDGNILTEDSRLFNLYGRFIVEELADGKVKYFGNWTGSEIEFSFKGTDAWLHLSGVEKFTTMEGVYMGVYIDGSDEPDRIVEVRGEDWYQVVEGLPDGDHNIRVFKHSEAFTGKFSFYGIKIKGPGHFNLPPPKPQLSLEIIGDSITAGFGNMAANQSVPFNVKQENGYLTYGVMLARKLSAQAHYLAWSGIGVLQNNDGRKFNTMPKIYKQTFPDISLSYWDFASYVPDIIVINLGTNDMASNAVPEDFKQTYIKFLELVRENNPTSAIFCTMGSMGTRLVPSMVDAVEEFKQAGNDKVFAVPLPVQSAADGYGAAGHPSVKTHEKIADLLYEEINNYLKGNK